MWCDETAIKQSQQGHAQLQHKAEVCLLQSDLSERVAKNFRVLQLNRGDQRLSKIREAAANQS